MVMSGTRVRSSRCRHCRFRQLLKLSETFIVEMIPQAVIMNCDEADGLLGFRVADAFCNARRWPMGAQIANGVEAHKLAVLRAVHVPVQNRPLFQVLLVDRFDDEAASRFS